MRPLAYTPAGIYGSSIHQNKFPVQDNHYNRHDSLQAHFMEGIDPLLKLLTFSLSPFNRHLVHCSLIQIVELKSVSAVGARTILEDDRVLESIEASFRQFHGFLDLLKGSK